MEREIKICSKNNQKMLPVLDYSFWNANFDFEFEFTICGVKTSFWLCEKNAIFKILL